MTLAALPDGGTIVAAAGADHTVRTWDASSGAHPATLAGHHDEVNGVAAVTLADGTPIVVTGSSDTNLCVWELDGNLIMGLPMLCDHQCGIAVDLL